MYWKNISFHYVAVNDRRGKKVKRMDLANQYEYTVIAIKQAVEKSRYRAAKAGNARISGGQRFFREQY